MFCALTIINLASIVLNIPRSSLPSARSFGTICQTKRPTVFAYDNTSTVTALSSADTILRLLIVRSSESMKSMSPCFSCVLAFAATTHLSAYCLGQDKERMRCLREYLQVSLGALDSMGQIWPIAKAVKGQLAEFSREIFTKQSSNSNQAHAQPEDLAAILPFELVPGVQDDLWLQDLVSNEMDFSLVE